MLAPRAGAAAAAPGAHSVVRFAQPRSADERLLVYLLRAAQLPKVCGELSRALVLPDNATISVQGGSSGPFYDPQTRTIVLNHPFSALRVFQRGLPEDQARAARRAVRRARVLRPLPRGRSRPDRPVEAARPRPRGGRRRRLLDPVHAQLIDRGDFALAGAVKEGGFADEHSFDRARRAQRLPREREEGGFADEHSFDKQRAYSIACWVYGSNTTRYGYLRSVLPAERRSRCQAEYRQLKRSWLSLLRPPLRLRYSPLRNERIGPRAGGRRYPWKRSPPVGRAGRKRGRQMANLADIEGIGSVYAEKLAAAGVSGVDDLLAAGATPQGRSELAAKTGVSPDSLVDHVRQHLGDRLRGFVVRDAELLRDCAIWSSPITSFT